MLSRKHHKVRDRQKGWLRAIGDGRPVPSRRIALPGFFGRHYQDGPIRSVEHLHHDIVASEYGVRLGAVIPYHDQVLVALARRRQDALRGSGCFLDFDIYRHIHCA